MSQRGSLEGLRMQFATAGKSLPEESRFAVKDCVFVPDGNACDSVGYAKCYKAPPEKEDCRRAIDISARMAALMILFVLVATGIKLLDCIKTKTQLTSELVLLNQNSEEIAGKNAALTFRIDQARDEARICYIASRELGMISSEGVDIIYLRAPDTRPFQNAHLKMSQIAGTSASAQN